MDQYGFILCGNSRDRLPLTALAQQSRRQRASSRLNSTQGGTGVESSPTGASTGVGADKPPRMNRDAIQQALDIALQQLGQEHSLLGTDTGAGTAAKHQSMRLRTAAASLSEAYGVRWVGMAEHMWPHNSSSSIWPPDATWCVIGRYLHRSLRERMALTRGDEHRCVRQAHAELQRLLDTITASNAQPFNMTVRTSQGGSSRHVSEHPPRPNRIQAAVMYRAEVEQHIRAGLTLTHLLLAQLEGKRD
jgi:hypothetical protein